jgi:hypothetical protein
LVHPDEVIADTPQRRGVTDEVLLSEDALSSLYDRLSLLVREVDQMVLLYFHRWRLSEEADEEKRQQLARDFIRVRAQFLALREAREALPPLPKFPDRPQRPPGLEGA